MIGAVPRTPALGGTRCSARHQDSWRLVQTETYRGLLARKSARTISRTRASFEALNQAIKQRTEHDQQAAPE